jgi:hypothetical protein
MEQGFDYNDEYYFQVDGGSPDSFFTDKKSAEEAAEVKGLEEFKRLVKDGSIREYSYGGLRELIADSVTEEDLLYEDGIFKTVFGTSAEEWFESGAGWSDREVGLKVEPTEEQWKKLFSCFNLDFYSVVTVQKG